MHGGKSPQAIRKARVRREVSSLLQEDVPAEDRRSPDEIMLDVVQRLDWLLRTGDFTRDTVGYLDLAERVFKLARLLVDSDVLQRVAAAQERRLDVEATVLTAALLAGLDSIGLPAEHRMRALVAAHAALHGVSPPDAPAPALPPALAARSDGAGRSAAAVGNHPSLAAVDGSGAYSASDLGVNAASSQR